MVSPPTLSPVHAQSPPRIKKPRVRFERRNATQAEEDAFDIVGERNVLKPSGVIASIAHMVKGALGSGVLSAHVAYMTAGVWVAIPLNIVLGIYMGYCLYTLVISAQILYRRTGVPVMTYPDVGQAACHLFPNPRIARLGKFFRYIIDVIICIDLFGACATYQIVIAKTIKQLVENSEKQALAGAAGYPHLRVYLAAMIIPCILICLLRHLQWLAPFSFVGNCLLVFCIVLTIYYAFENNPKFANLVAATSIGGVFQFTGMVVFSMSCAGVVIPIENNMKDPHKYPLVLIIGMVLTVGGVITTAFFGYVAYTQNSIAPITVNFPLTTFPKIVKGCVAGMIYITHALNFWVPFNLCFYYIKKLHSEKRIVLWELLYRAIFVTLIALVGISFPSVTALMGFLGCFCLSNMAFIWPNVIELLVIWERPGLGKFKWRLWKCIILITIGLVFWSAGTVESVQDLIETYKAAS